MFGCALAAATVLLWPLTRGGYLLGHDMVFTPRQPLGLASIGLSSAEPRAVPLDALVALAERVVDGAAVGRLALLLPVLAAGLGAAALLRTPALAARVAACVAAVWNPFVVERFGLGQWALLWAYAALPWIVLAITRGAGASGWFARAVALAAASITPTGATIAAVTAVAVAVGVRRPRREVWCVAALAIVLQLPWLLPALVSTASATSDPAGVTLFAARAEHPGGVLLTLLGGGGVWDAEVVPGSRSGGAAWLWLAVLVIATWYGLPRLRSLIGTRLVAVLALLSGAGLLLAMLPALPGGASVARWAVESVPGAGLLRDSQKWLLPLVLFEALLFGAAMLRAGERLRELHWRVALAVAAIALPVLALPDAAASLRSTLTPVHYPRDWAAVARRLDSGDAAVLPWGSYRRFAWAPGRSVLDPAPRLLPVQTVVDDRLAVSGQVIAGEDPRADEVRRALDDRSGPVAGLRRAGVTWVVVEHGTPGVVPDLTGLRLVRTGADVTLYEVPGVISRYRVRPARVAVVVAGDVLAGLVLVTLFGWLIYERAMGARSDFRPGDTRPVAGRVGRKR